MKNRIKIIATALFLGIASVTPAQSSSIFDDQASTGRSSESSTDSMFNDSSSTYQGGESALDGVKRARLEKKKAVITKQKNNKNSEMEDRCHCVFNICLQGFTTGKSAVDGGEGWWRLDGAVKRKQTLEQACQAWKKGGKVDTVELDQKLSQIDAQIYKEREKEHALANARKQQQQLENSKKSANAKQEKARKRAAAENRRKEAKDRELASCNEYWAKKINVCGCAGFAEAPAWVKRSKTCAK